MVMKTNESIRNKVPVQCSFVSLSSPLVTVPIYMFRRRLSSDLSGEIHDTL